MRFVSFQPFTLCSEKKRDSPLQSQGIGLPLSIFIISSVLFELGKINGVYSQARGSCKTHSFVTQNKGKECERSVESKAPMADKKCLDDRFNATKQSQHQLDI